MEKVGIIKKVEEPTICVNPIVIVKKPNGEVGICLDPVDLNEAVKNEHYPAVKTVEEVVARQGQATLLSTLDATSAFYQTGAPEGFWPWGGRGAKKIN